MNLSKTIMVNPMNQNKTIVTLTLIGALFIIILPTILSIYKNHENRLELVATKKITESAETCRNDNVCKKEKITIEELKQTGYLKEDVVNPKTKEYFSGTTYVIFENNNYVLKEIK